jgi:hypothetical protein
MSDVEAALGALSAAERRYADGRWALAPAEHELAVALRRIVAVGRPTLAQIVFEGATPVTDPDLADLIDLIRDALQAGRASDPDDRAQVLQRFDEVLTVPVWSALGTPRHQQHDHRARHAEAFEAVWPSLSEAERGLLRG